MPAIAQKVELIEMWSNILLSLQHTLPLAAPDIQDNIVSVSNLPSYDVI